MGTKSNTYHPSANLRAGSGTEARRSRATTKSNTYHGDTETLRKNTEKIFGTAEARRRGENQKVKTSNRRSRREIDFDLYGTKFGVAETAETREAVEKNNSAREQKAMERSGPITQRKDKGLLPSSKNLRKKRRNLGLVLLRH